ncbi:hypothetical protein K491DRAFT_686612 [Lophiostoma macrostomum CBS 122681]|uniref:Uncharacterized protein n=1 Tax=Lophiostoma macrostomum CBS 122681 TaxID=1314788 RepID=A0A6A6TPV8_9PLEO|nr:hypothetical protein K491DRAFT_686612 [Lophiostoma macrostomum CBS 122681]
MAGFPPPKVNCADLGTKPLLPVGHLLRHDYRTCFTRDKLMPLLAYTASALLLYSNTNPRPRLPVAAVALASLTCVHWAFDTMTSVQSRVDLDRKTPSNDTIQNLVQEMSFCLIPCFALLTPVFFLVFGTEEVAEAKPHLDIGTIIFRATFNALFWMCTFEVTKRTSWAIVPSFLTFAELSAVAFTSIPTTLDANGFVGFPDFLEVIFLWSGSLKVLQEAANMLPEGIQGRSILRCFMLWPFHSLEIVSRFLQTEVRALLDILADVIHGITARTAPTGTT